MKQVTLIVLGLAILLAPLFGFAAATRYVLPGQPGCYMDRATGTGELSESLTPPGDAYITGMYIKSSASRNTGTLLYGLAAESAPYNIILANTDILTLESPGGYVNVPFAFPGMLVPHTYTYNVSWENLSGNTWTLTVFWNATER